MPFYIKPLALAFLMILNTCAQTKNRKDNNTMQETITLDNVADHMWSEMPKFEKQPMYFFRANAHNCVYEILINGFLVERHYRLGWNATPTEFNTDILKSGKQTLTYRLYPLGDLLGDGERVNSLLSTTQIEIEVFRVDDHRDYTKAEDEKIILNHTSAKKEGKFVGTGLPYYEYTFEFEAKVPYVNEGWSNGIDLRKEDSIVLRAKVAQFYNNYKNLYLDKDVNKLLKSKYPFNKRRAIANYKTKKEVLELWDGFDKNKRVENKEFQPLKNYDLQYAGDGKVVFFKHFSKEPIDKRLRGKPALYFLYNNESRVSFIPIYLYAPKDKQQNGLYLEMMK